MSLQLVANHLAQKGRGPDSTLVHMSNKEVAGLQALAKRHGGELSVNPDTGLPEAGFLDSILPTIAGAGLTYFSGGAITPMMAAGIVGGISALDSKDLSKGLMAGLGAYGGAGLTQGFMGAGLGAVGPELSAQAAADATSQGLQGEAYNQAVQNQVASGLAEKNLAAEGVSQLFSNPGQTLETIGGGSGYKAAGILGAAAAPMLADEMVETTTEAPEQSRGMIRPYTYSRQQVPQDYQGQQGNMGSKERRYFNESYTAGDPYAAAGGGLVALASGGYTNQNIFRPTTPLPANNMYGASRDAYDYLMGVNPTSGTGGGTGGGTDGIGTPPPTGTGKYVFDPVTKQYKWVPDPIKPVDVAPVFENPMQSGGGGGRGEREPEDPNSFSAQWAAMNDAEKEAWRLENPNTALAQDVVGLIASPFKFAYDKLQTFMGPDSSTGGPARYERTPVTPDVEADVFGGYPVGVTPNPYSMGPGTPGFNPVGTTPGSAHAGQGGYGGVHEGQQGYGQDVGGSPGAAHDGQQGYGQDVGGSPGAAHDGQGGYGQGVGSSPGGAHDGQGGYGQGVGSSPGGAHDGQGGYGGNGDARGGYLQHGQFDQHMAHGGIANLYNLGSYSDGGRLLKGPGDGISDDIPATIGQGQPARLADGEFVIPARIVSEIGNGSTDAGARELYKMMDRIQAGRKKTVGKDQVAKNSKSVRHLPA